MTLAKNNPSRRDFLKKTAVGLTGLSLGLAGAGITGEAKALAGDLAPPDLKVEPKPTIRVLRWKAFVQSEIEVWLANTRKWEKRTGGRVITDFLSWEDVRPKAAMEAIIGTGHDLTFGWFDDPHLFRDSVMDLSELGEYLGKKYGGWYSVCEKYGRDSYNGRWIGLPICISGACINYRKSWLKQAGYDILPDNIIDFIKCCRALKAQGRPTGFALGYGAGDPNTWTHWWLWSFGGKAVEKDGKTVCINSPETLQALDAARELFETMTPGVDQWADPDNNRAFLGGKISLTANGASIPYEARHKYPMIYEDLATANLPVGLSGRPAELSLLSQAFIYKHTNVPNAVKDYLLFMFDGQNYADWIDNSWGYITQSLEAHEGLPVWTKEAPLKPYRNCVRRMRHNGYAGPVGRASAETLNEFIILEMIADVCLGRKSCRDSALNAEKRLVRIYGY